MRALDEVSFIEVSWLDVAVEVPNYNECLERCLGRLSDEDRKVITEYYRYKKTEKINLQQGSASL
jgi:hypothetical protein